MTLKLTRGTGVNLTERTDYSQDARSSFVLYEYENGVAFLQSTLQARKPSENFERAATRDVYRATKTELDLGKAAFDRADMDELFGRKGQRMGRGRPLIAWYSCRSRHDHRIGNRRCSFQLN